MGTYRRFGFDVTKIDPSYPRGQNTKELNFLIKISKYKHYPTPDYQCQPDSADTKTLHLCQKEYYARKMNCLLPWYADSEDGSETIR